MNVRSPALNLLSVMASALAMLAPVMAFGSLDTMRGDGSEAPIVQAASTQCGEMARVFPGGGEEEFIFCSGFEWLASVSLEVSAAGDWSDGVTIAEGGEVSVRWKAQAESCTYSGTDLSPEGPVNGAEACDGLAACADGASFTKSFGTPGTYPLRLDCTLVSAPGATPPTSSAWAEAAILVQPAPVLNLSITPVSGMPGSEVTLSWNPVNLPSGTECTRSGGFGWWPGTFTYEGGGGGMIGPVPGGTPPSVTFTLTCGATSESVNFVVMEPPATCMNQANRITFGDVRYLPSHSLASGVDLTEWNQVFGRNFPYGPVTGWPGHPSSAPQIFWVGQDKFIALRFTVPANNPYARGQVTHHKNWPGPNLDVTISTKCGDFSAYGTPGSGVLSPYCYLPDRQGGQVLFIWNRPGGPPSNACILPPGEYYLNLKMTNPGSAAGHPDCMHMGGGVYGCKETLENGFSTN